MPSSSPSSLPSGMPSESPSSAPSISSQPSDSPSSSPSLSPSLSHLPSYSPSVSLMPSMDRMSLVSTSSGSVTAAYGVMFEVKALRAITVETFAVKRFVSSDAFHFHIFTKVGSFLHCVNIFSFLCRNYAYNDASFYLVWVVRFFVMEYCQRMDKIRRSSFLECQCRSHSFVI